LAIAWNRWQDWALLKVDATPKAFLNRGDSGAANVGDHCVFLELGPVGSKLTDGTVTGTNSFPRAGARLLVASGVSPQSIGGALLDEFGNYVGIIGGSIVPSANPIRILALLSESGASSVSLDWETTGLAVPQSLLPDLPSNAPPTSLAELANRGEFAPLVIKSNSIQYMSITSAIGKDSGSIPFPRDSKQIFSRRDTRAVVYLADLYQAKICLQLAVFHGRQQNDQQFQTSGNFLGARQIFLNQLGSSRWPYVSGHLPH
jgi:hypothetical protein